jgi:hypothetical protein
MFHGDKYLEERDVSIDTAVSESGTLCILQADKEIFEKHLSE